ncbi:MAG: HDOD domain-containing protein, partial [Burkholderiales bacterium]|nr:HDOD domain-containing protein [Burkholderiales bacterium]
LRLGTDIVREIGEAQLLGLWMRHGARLVDQGLLRDLWLEYLMTAHSARAITEALGDDLDPVLLYAAGLLHDIGTLALCWEEPHAMARFIRTGYGYGTPLREAFVQAHSRLGGTLLRQWRAPAALAITAERHHNALGPRETATTLVVFLADHLHAAILAREDVAVTPTGEFALGCFGGATEPVSAALAALGLTEKLDKILAEVGATSHRLELAAAAVGG